MNDVLWFVGIDWAPQRHAVCILDHAGHVVERRQVEHTAAALQGFVEGLLARAQGDPTTVAIAMEVPRGAVVELLVERGFQVYAINPKQLDRFRDRFTVAGAKDDRFDAQVLAASLRTDAPAFRRVALDDPRVIQLREWSRLDEDLSLELSQLTNRLRELVYRMAPALLRVCPAADEAWFWKLLEDAPTPTAQRRLPEAIIGQLLRSHRLRRLTAAEVVAALREPAPYTAPGVVDAVVAHVRLILPRLELVARQRRHAERELERLLDALEGQAPGGDQREHADVAIVRSMPGIGTRIAARMLAEASQPLALRAYHILRGVLGVAPVTRQSGRRRLVLMRRGCHHRLRDAAYHWARVATQRDDPSRSYYRALRLRGHTHGRALRSVADRLLRILCALLRDGQLFDPIHHRTLSLPPVTL